MRVPAQPRAVQELLNESRAFELSAGVGDAAQSALRAEDLAEQLLYEVQSLDLPARRRLMPRVYGFAAAQANASAAVAPPPPQVLAAAAARSVFGWPAGRQADAAAASCICLVLLAAAGGAFALGARRVRFRASCCLLIASLTHRSLRSVSALLRLWRRRAMWSSRATSAGARESPSRSTAPTTATPELSCYAA